MVGALGLSRKLVRLRGKGRGAYGRLDICVTGAFWGMLGKVLRLKAREAKEVSPLPFAHTWQLPPARLPPGRTMTTKGFGTLQECCPG